MRIATYNTELSRDCPGLLLRDLERGKDPQIAAVIQVIADAHPDVHPLQQKLQQAGARYPHIFALQPNAGLATELDLDGNNRLGEPRNSQGYGVFTGQSGIAVLSKLPIDYAAVRDFSPMLWRDLPDALLPQYPMAPRSRPSRH
nr:endonuclease/exonuclease/phosphatase family protein [Parasedimentitalea psychrophila]